MPLTPRRVQSAQVPQRAGARVCSLHNVCQLRLHRELGMKRIGRVAGNVAANLAALAVLPFLVLAWVTRVYVLEFLARRAIARPPPVRAVHPHLGWTSHERLRR